MRKLLIYGRMKLPDGFMQCLMQQEAHTVEFCSRVALNIDLSLCVIHKTRGVTLCTHGLVLCNIGVHTDEEDIVKEGDLLPLFTESNEANVCRSFGCVEFINVFSNTDDLFVESKANPWDVYG